VRRNDQLDNDFKRCARKCYWPKLRFKPGVFVDQLRNITKTLVMVTATWRGLNCRPFEHEAMLPLASPRICCLLSNTRLCLHMDIICAPLSQVIYAFLFSSPSLSGPFPANVLPAGKCHLQPHITPVSRGPGHELHIAVHLKASAAVTGHFTLPPYV
jgi:hypothetical protein